MVTIRQGVPDDADAIGRLHVRAWQHAYAGIMPADHLASLDPATSANRHRAQLLEQAARAGDTDRVRRAGAAGAAAGSAPPVHLETIVGCGDDGVVAGFVAFGPYRRDEDPRLHDPDHGEIYAIYVDPDALGTGVGAALMRAALERLTTLGRADVRLWVLAGNARARRFYTRAGFAPDGMRKDFTLLTRDGTQLGLPEVRYARPLRPARS